MRFPDDADGRTTRWLDQTIGRAIVSGFDSPGFVLNMEHQHQPEEIMNRERRDAFVKNFVDDVDDAVGGLNKSQIRTVEFMAYEIWETDMFGMIDADTEYEIKKFDVDVHSWGFSISTAVGRHGDEGTAAEFFCRNRRHVMIGRRGGATAYNYKNGKTRRLVGNRALRCYEH